MGLVSLKGQKVTEQNVPSLIIVDADLRVMRESVVLSNELAYNGSAE